MPTFKSYLTGFITSVALTLLAYALITIHINSHHKTFSHPFLLYSVISLAIIQLVIQLAYFLHLNKGENSRWNLIIFTSTIAIILILVIGSVWIMDHLNYNMSPQQQQDYMNNSDGL